MIELELKTETYGKYYYIKGTNIYHREDGPAIEYADGNKLWYQHGKHHRLDGPAVEYASGHKEWYQHGKRHREDGPAVKFADGAKLWYLDDRQINCQTQQEFEKLIKLKIFW